MYQIGTAYDLRDAISGATFDESLLTNYRYLSDHLPTSARIYHDKNPIATFMTCNLLSRAYFKYDSGFNLDGTPFTKPWNSDGLMDIRDQFGIHISPLTKMRQEDREEKISEWLFKWV